MSDRLLLCPPTRSAKVRGQDPKGSGWWGASRDGGARRHEGLDWLAEPGEDVLWPCEGVLLNLGYAYDGNYHYRIIDVDAGPALVRLYYATTDLELGSRGGRGEVIGTCQDISARYGGGSGGMLNHVHMAVILKGLHTGTSRDVAVNPWLFLVI